MSPREQVMHALWQAEVPLEAVELIDLPAFANKVLPLASVQRVLYDLKHDGAVIHRDDGAWETRDTCEECGDDHAVFRKQWERVLCNTCHNESCDMAEGDQAFDLKHDR